MNIAIVIGTRPEIIKMAPLIRILTNRNIPYVLIHSNQHYSSNMDEIFFQDLQLPQPTYNLGIGSADHGNQTGRMLMEIEKILLKERPDIVLCQGDTNTVLAGILAASKQDILTGHVEAGLRSYDRRMPEEKNRIICDVLSDFLFAPTSVQKGILEGEGIPSEKIYVVGNTIVDAVYQHKELAENQSKILSTLDVKEKEYVLLTAHRSLNVDTYDALEHLVNLVNQIKDITGLDVIYPIHPRTRVKLDQYGLEIINARLIDPLGYLDFLTLEMHAGLIVTDSGGIQEEACILNIPCITIRENTERPETVTVGANKLSGLDIQRFKDAYEYHKNNQNKWENPFGDGHTAERIVEIITSKS